MKKELAPAVPEKRQKIAVALKVKKVDVNVKEKIVNVDQKKNNFKNTLDLFRGVFMLK
jgi:hypothetical protein